MRESAEGVAQGIVQERRHRGACRAGIGAVLLASVLPLLPQFGELVVPLVEQCRMVLSSCLLAVRASGAVLQWAPWALGAVGLVHALVDRMRVSHRLTRLLALHHSRPPRPGERIAGLAAEYGVTGRVRVLTGVAPNPAFTAGLRAPRLYLAASLQETLTEHELRAVFRHELHHLRRRDPFRFAALRFVAKTLFWVPLVPYFVEDLMEDAEILADDYAATPDGGTDPLDVAGALLKIGRGGVAPLAGVASLGGYRLLERRVRRLAGEPVGGPAPLPRRLALLSGGGLLLLWAAATFAPGAASAGMTMRWGDPCPHPMPAAGARCPACEEHHGAMPDCAEGLAHGPTHADASAAPAH